MSEPPFLLCASDLDGTLLNANHALTPFTMAAIYRIEKERRVPFVLATGRHHLSVRVVRESLEGYFIEKEKESVQAAAENGGAATAPPPGFYLISSNGARIHDGAGRLVFERNLDPDVVRALFAEFGLPYTKKRYAGPPGTATPPMATTPVTRNEATGQYVRVRANGEDKSVAATGSTADDEVGEDAVHQNDEEPADVVATSAYTTDQWFMTSTFLPDEEMIKKFGFLPTSLPFDVHDAANEGKSIFDEFPTEGVGKVCFRCSNTGMLAFFERAIKARFPGRVSVALSSNYCLDVMAAGVSKADALAALAQRLSPPQENSGEPGCNTDKEVRSTASATAITLSHVIAFGDSMNDKLMLQSVGKGCIMQNAQPRLKKELPQCEVIGHHEDNAVAKKLLEVFGL